MYLPITDAGLAHLRGLTHLRLLWIDNTQITDVGLQHLKEMTGMFDLHLVGTRVTGEGVAKLQPFLPKCQISGP